MMTLFIIVVIIVSLTHLQQLNAGEFTAAYRASQHQAPITRLQISAQLTEFPAKIFELATKAKRWVSTGKKMVFCGIFRHVGAVGGFI